jgi:hypothetical protein
MPEWRATIPAREEHMVAAVHLSELATRVGSVSRRHMNLAYLAYLVDPVGPRIERYRLLEP